MEGTGVFLIGAGSMGFAVTTGFTGAGDVPEEAVAVEGITVFAPAPVNPPAMPWTSNVGANSSPAK